MDNFSSDRIGPKVRAISNSFRRIADNVTAELDITGVQSFLIGYLYGREDDLPCQHDIEVRFNIKHPTATGILKRLEEKGIVEFRPDRRDRRLKRIALTEKGRAAAETTHATLEYIEMRLTQSLTDEERTELHRLLDKLVANAMKIRNESSHEREENRCLND